MTDVTPAPSSLLNTAAVAARWSLRLVAAAWLFFLLTWGALHLVIVPRIGEFRPQLEARATQILGVTVRVGAVVAHSSGMMPSFELTDVRLFDAQGREALRLPRVLASLSPRSLLHLGFEQIYLDRPALNVRRAPDGKISVAGLDFSKPSETDRSAVEWFFSQIEFAIHDGTLEWSDELRGAPPLALTQVELVVRHRGRRHELGIDATPPALWGERFSLRGQFLEPLLTRHDGRWEDWEGQLYAAFSRVDLSELRRYADVGIDIRQGNGALTSWVDVSRAQVVGAVADVALAEVSVTLGAGLQPLQLRSVRGRLGGHALAAGFDFSTQALGFDTADGLHWPGGNVSVRYLGAEGKTAAAGEFKADRLDLAALAQIADRLPIEAPLRSALLAYAPKGLVERVQASWQGAMGAPSQYQAKGVVSNLEVTAVAGLPGIRGARIEFDLNKLAGSANLNIANGALVLPQVFDDPQLAVTLLSAQARWQIKGEQIAVQLPVVKFANADAQGEAQIKWQTSDPQKSASRARFPGVLDLQGTLSRVDGTRVYRYLPSVIDRGARDYVREAVTAGGASGVKFRLKGDLHDMPFSDPKLGEFRISGDVHNASYGYVPRSLQAAGELPWPALTQLNGELVFDRTRMQVRGARARMGPSLGVQFNKIEAVIPDLRRAEVSVSGEGHGPLTEGLRIVNGSPLAEITGQALSRAVASGNADYKLKLTLPIANLEKSKVQGSVALAGNDLQITPDTPRLMRSRGVVTFSESGFAIVGGQARMLGGDARLEGGTTPPGASATAAPILIRASGTASADGLRQARELGFVARLAQQASGSAAYTAALGIRRGVPELSVLSNLQGLALSLPAPLSKSADALLPLRLETALLRESLASGAPGGPARLRDQFVLELGRVASAVYVRDVSGPESRVIRGGIGVGLGPGESAPLPEEGVVANINLNAFDADAWAAVLSHTAGTPLTGVAEASPGRPGGPPPSVAAMSYLPTSMAVRARELTFGSRKFTNIVVGGSREGLLWRANLDATELNGYFEYRQPSGTGEGRLHARLARLTIAPSLASEVEALLSEQPASIPALDIVVDDFELRGKRLGRVEVEALNRGGGATVREWRLGKFNMITPEAVLNASGVWAGTAASPRRRTLLDFKLEIADSGKLLARFGMPGVVRGGRGKIEGQLTWAGSPLGLDYPSMGGAFTVNVESGQFLQAEPGIAKLLGVLSLQALPRRLTLDFRDVFSEGFAFDFVRGDVNIQQGIARTNNLQMKGVNAAVLMEGSSDIAKETQDLRVVVVPEINAGTASLIATVINPAVGLGTFLAQLFLRRPLAEAATQEFHIDGAWADPKISKVPRTQPSGESGSGAASGATPRP